MDPVVTSPVDTSHALSHYYISSSHNTYLSGHQLYGKASAEAYKEVLENGCRCVEIDVWDGEDSPLSATSIEDVARFQRLGLTDRSDGNEGSPYSSRRAEPCVMHGYTATKNCSFRSIIREIGQHAFVFSDAPLIISLEVHTSREQQMIMVEILHQYLGQYLVDQKIPWSEDMPLPKLSDLTNKILIKVKYSAPHVKPKTKKESDSDTSSSSEDESQVESVKKGKIIPELGQMGYFTRSFRFSSLEQPEACYPTHVFSMSEGKLNNLQAKHHDELFEHNKSFFVRAFPRATRISSTNLDPTALWRLGIQMVALNWQRLDAAMMLNHAMFSNTNGYVLKPAGYRPASGSIRRETLCLKVDFLSGTNLVGNRKGKLRAYVKVELHVETSSERREDGLPKYGKVREGDYKARTNTYSCKEVAGGDLVEFHGQQVIFDNVRDVVPELTFVRFKVMDDERAARDELVGWNCFRLDRLPIGKWKMDVLDEKAKATDGKIILNVEKNYTPN